MSYQQQQDIFIQELAFTPEMVQAKPGDLVGPNLHHAKPRTDANLKELGTVSGGLLPFRRKSAKEVGVFDLNRGQKISQFVADELPITPRPGAGCLAPNGSIFACVKGPPIDDTRILY